MFDFDDADIQSRSPKGNKSSSRSGRVNRSRGNSNVSIGGKTPSDTPKQRKGTGYKSSSKAVPSVPLGGVRWSCGSCTRLGVRPSNEDRLSAIPNLMETGLGCKAKTSQSQSLSYTSNTSNSLSNGHIRHSSNTHTHSQGQGQSQAGFSGGMGVPMSVPMSSAQERHGFFAVYDGHCGAQAAIHLQETLHFTIFNHPLYYTDLQTAIQEACISTDIAFLEESRAKNQYSGTTALGAIVQGSELVVFNIGDCHAVLCCSGAALDMSDAHKPNR
jgi:Protein phosphatase 2C